MPEGGVNCTTLSSPVASQNDPSGASTIRPEAAVEISTNDRTAHHEHVVAPRVVGTHRRARTRRIERPAKIGHGKCRDVALHSLNTEFIPEGAKGLADLRQQSTLARRLIRVRVEASNLNVKYLPRYI